MVSNYPAKNKKKKEPNPMAVSKKDKTQPNGCNETISKQNQLSSKEHISSSFLQCSSWIMHLIKTNESSWSAETSSLFSLWCRRLLDGWWTVTGGFLQSANWTEYRTHNSLFPP